MPISATGAEPRPAEAGFTLVELMVVLVIVGVMTSAVLLSSPGRPRLAREADALALRLGKARDEAVMGAHAVEVLIDADGYAFRSRSRAGWTPLGRPFVRQAWSDGVRVSLSGADADGAVRFDVTGAATPAVVALARGGERLRVRIDGSGTVRVDETAE